MGVWISHHLMGGGFVETPSNSAPRRHSDKPKNAFESSSEVLRKYFWQLFAKVNIEVAARVHRRSNLAKFHIPSEMFHYLRTYYR